jgi:hypothetical protein
VKKQCRSLYDKYKSKREVDKDVGDYKEYPFIFTRYYKILKRIVYELDRLKKRTKL